ncbi:Clampless1 Clp1 protein [Mycena venus]|uniref:Clampless1 Clp1 protein n=1 Tax=Mycena venus TaxID=2733690 RepID=A0A8H7CML5_9AGAR|nr:Clampless1 Clp1 protein [Mycena venus]
MDADLLFTQCPIRTMTATKAPKAPVSYSSFTLLNPLYTWPPGEFPSPKIRAAMSYPDAYVPPRTRPTEDGSDHSDKYPITAIPSTDNLPMTLPRAAGGNTDDVSRPLLAAYTPELAHMPARALRTYLYADSKRFIAGLAAVQIPGMVPRNQLPPTFTVPAPTNLDPANRDGPRPIYPTYVIAVSSRPSIPDRTPFDAPVPLVAVHGAIIGANCTKVDLPLPVTQPTDLRLVSLATYRLTVYSVPAFVILRLYMYNHRVDTFMDAIMPFPKAFLHLLKPDTRTPGHEGFIMEGAMASAKETRRLAQHLIFCTPGGAYPMWERVRMLHGVWQTMCDLGMYEPVLWLGLDLAWQVARYSLVVVSVAHQKELDAEAAKQAERRP